MTFIAKRDLSEKDFAMFSEQHRGSLRRQLRMLAHYRREAANAEKGAQSVLRSINETRRDALRHGVELPW